MPPIIESSASWGKEQWPRPLLALHHCKESQEKLEPFLEVRKTTLKYDFLSLVPCDNTSPYRRLKTPRRWGRMNNYVTISNYCKEKVEFHKAQYWWDKYSWHNTEGIVVANLPFVTPALCPSIFLAWLNSDGFKRVTAWDFTHLAVETGKTAVAALPEDLHVFATSLQWNLASSVAHWSPALPRLCLCSPAQLWEILNLELEASHNSTDATCQDSCHAVCQKFTGLLLLLWYLSLLAAAVPIHSLPTDAVQGKKPNFSCNFHYFWAKTVNCRIKNSSIKFPVSQDLHYGNPCFSMSSE